jgi:hypothetical protein
MRYGVFCKHEYFDTWASILKEELAGFATVHIVDPAQVKTVSDDTNAIVSPSGNYSIAIDISNNICKDGIYVVSDSNGNIVIKERAVYLVFDGGYLLFSEKVDENRTFMTIMLIEWQKNDNRLFKEVEKRTYSILDRMDIDYKPLNGLAQN